MKIKPTQHTASDDVRALSIESRKCRYMSENHVSVAVAYLVYNIKHLYAHRSQTVCSPSIDRKDAYSSAKLDIVLTGLGAHHGIFLFLKNFLP